MLRLKNRKKEKKRKDKIIKYWNIRLIKKNKSWDWKIKKKKRKEKKK